MTSFRQIEANRRNAFLSTGPTTEAGKRRSRRNAVRHGLTAETVVDTLEDIEDYRGFEAAVIASYDARNAVERELVLRLASLLWRLRRATAIETDLLRIQAEISRDVKFHRDASGWPQDTRSLGLASKPSSVDDVDQDGTDDCSVHHEVSDGRNRRPQLVSPSRELAHCFLRLVNVESGVFERLGRYESALARQVFRTLLLLKSARVR
jgi:hypothetical protein